MYFNYRDIDFDINEKCVSENEVKKFFDGIIDFVSRVNIFEIIVEDRDTSYIYLEKMGDINSWDQESMDFAGLLEENGYQVLYADEDYGDSFDVLIIYNEIANINIIDDEKMFQDCVTKILDLGEHDLINLIKNIMDKHPKSMKTILKY